MEEKLIPEVEGMKNEALVPETIETETTETVVADVQNNEEEPVEVAPEVNEPEAAEKTAPQSKEEVVARLKELVQNGGDVERAELESLKQVYYRLHNAQAAAAREEYIAAGGDPETFMPAPDPLEADFKAQMSLLREIRAKAFEAAEKEKQDNLEKKLAIIEKMKEMAVSPDEADKNYEAFKGLQAEWKEIKNVPAEKVTELWKSYQLYVEQFYDQLRLNHEMRAYDFKKNLEIKTRLCEAAEKLAELEDVISAFHQLQNLHQEYRETGPVVKELREELWTRFKNASTAVNKRHQAHFEAIKAQEEENLVKKTQLCEQVEALAAAEQKGFADWEKATQEVLELQAQWKTIGFTSKKTNAKIFERFRAACDNFFQSKTEYFKNTRETLNANLAAKTALCEKAEALKDSTDWNATSAALVALQKEWKATGPVAHKVSEAIWTRFNAACNYFFEQKNAATASVRETEEANLEKKNAIIEKLAALAENPVTAETMQQVKALQAEWNEVGHVPFRKKEKMYKRYREVLDKLYKEAHAGAGRRHMENFKKNVGEKGGNELTRERNKLMTAYEAKKQEIKNYETNLTFFNSKSKKGNSLLGDLEKKVERLKEDLVMLAEKIAAVDEQIKADSKN